MAETAGGLVKRSVQYTREQFAWLQARAARKGLASLSSVVRELIDDAMDAEQQQRAPDLRAHLEKLGYLGRDDEGRAS